LFGTQPCCFSKGCTSSLAHRPVRASPENLEFNPFSLILRNRKIIGSLVGGILETQEMLDHCGKHGITSDIEMIAPNQINLAYERTLKGDVKYRFVIDCAKF